MAATVIIMGMISLPVMLRYGYDKRLATGGDCGIGNLGAVNSAELGAAGIERSDWSFGEGLVFGALIPGLMLSGSYILYVLGLAFLQPHVAPALPIEARQIQGRALVIKVMNAIVPPVLLIFVILGSIFFGFATPTEAGAVGAVGACALAAMNKRLNLKLLTDAAHATAVVSSVVMMILFSSSFFSLVFDALGGKVLITDLLVQLPGEKIAF